MSLIQSNKVDVILYPYTGVIGLYDKWFQDPEKKE